jgi:acyl-CoA thioesterase-1
MKALLLFFFVIGLSPNLRAYKVVFFGDSFTEGYSLAKTLAYPYVIEEKLLAIDPNSKVINAGVSGATSQSAVSLVKWREFSRSRFSFYLI